jgi:cell division inhibitor SepF
VSLFRTIAVYLGLGPDDEYDDGYLYDDPADEGRSGADRAATDREQARSREADVRPAAVAKSSPRGRGSAAAHDETSAVSAVRSLRPVPGEPTPAPAPRQRDQREPRQQPREPEVPQDAEPPVRPATVGRSKPSALSPQTFADAKVVADEFKQSIPVILNLQGLDRDLVRRLVDFSSGLCYGLDGTMEKIASQVFLLTPQSVKVTAEERRRIEERGFDR